jgi:carboxymethylenebutenolidase
VKHEQFAIPTPDGLCPSHLFTPADGTPRPAVIFYMDAGGVRPGLLAMAERLAQAGYAVLVPDLFYRFGSYGPLVPAEVFAGDFRAILGPMVATTGNAIAAADTEAFLAFLASRSDVLGSRHGAVGFCMGGGMAITAAGRWPDRFAAAASFHGGNLATDAPDSPHLLAPAIQAELHIGAAHKDGSYPPAMAQRFEQALTAANVRFTARTYPAMHGWMMPDFPVFDAAAAEDGWRTMLDLYDRTLG